VLKHALTQVQAAALFIGVDHGVEALTPDECHALGRALDLLLPTFTPIVLRLNS
jgi:hypothetical protein